MSTELVKHGVSGTLTVQTMDDLARMADMLAKSGYFKDAREAAQAGVKVLAGLEMGFGAFASMTGIHLIEGKPSVGANLLAQAVKRSGRYNYRVVTHTDAECLIAFFEAGEKIGESSFSMRDAQAAGVAGRGPWKSYPKAMLFARALSQGVRWHCPDVLGGTTAYVPEELGANVDGDGNVIEVARVERAAPDRPSLPAADPHPFDAAPPVDLDEIAMPPEAEQPELGVAPITGAQLKMLHTIGTKLGFTNGHRDDFRLFVADLIGRPLESSKDITKAEATKLLDHSQDEWAAMLDSWNAERQMAAEGAA